VDPKYFCRENYIRKKLVLKPEENGNFFSRPASKLQLFSLLRKAQGKPGEF
jgi:hypothetical protein